MNRYLKLIIATWLVIFSITSFSTPIETNQPKNKIKMDLPQICDFISRDGFIIAAMYQDGLTIEEVVDKIQSRNKKFPSAAFAMPGMLKMIFMLEKVKIETPEIFEVPDFPTAMMVATFNQCMKDTAHGWIQEVPGRAIIKRNTVPSTVPNTMPMIPNVITPKKKYMM